MKTEQISVFLENRAGRLSEVTRVLSEANINIRALSLADTSDFGILRMIVCSPKEAQKVLKEHGFTLGITNVVAVSVDDRPGGLDDILQTMTRNGINVEYMYAFAVARGASARFVFRFDDTAKAVAALSAAGIDLLDDATIFA